MILIDGQAELHAVGRRGLLDDRLFQDAMHPSLRGQIALAQAVLRELKRRGARSDGKPTARRRRLTPPHAARVRYGIDLETWKSLCLWGVHFGVYVQGLRYDSASRLRRKAIYAAAYDRLVAGARVDWLGLPNVGIPAPVPADPLTERGTGSKGPRGAL